MSRWEEPPPLSPAMLFQTQQAGAGCLSPRTGSWPGEILSTKSPLKYVSAKLLPSYPAPKTALAQGIIPPRHRTPHSPLVNFITFLFGHFSSLPRSHNYLMCLHFRYIEATYKSMTAMTLNFMNKLFIKQILLSAVEII